MHDCKVTLKCLTSKGTNTLLFVNKQAKDNGDLELSIPDMGSLTVNMDELRAAVEVVYQFRRCLRDARKEDS